MPEQLTLALAGTIRFDGDGGVTDRFADVAGLAGWLVEHADLIRQHLGPPDLPIAVADEATRQEVVALRRAVRTLLARAVAPAAPSRVDAASLLAPAAAVEHLNRVASRLPTWPALHWPDAAAPVAGQASGPADPLVRLTGTLAHAAIWFFASPACEELRACPAPRCVRYFIRAHKRQAWCKPSCGNRARVARHYQRHHRTDPPGR